MKDTKKKIKVKDLVINEKLVELRPVNIFWVNKYQQNFRSGAQFPPIVINRKTNKIVSGNHRATALRNEYGDEHEIDVILRSYKNDKEMLEDFVRENVTHGNPLSTISKKRIAIELVNIGATNNEIADIFNLPVRKIEQYGELKVLVTRGKREKDAVYKPIKRGPTPAKAISEHVYQEHIKSDRGMTFVEIGNQILRWCKNGWIESNEENLMLAEKMVEELKALVDSMRVAA